LSLNLKPIKGDIGDTDREVQLNELLGPGLMLKNVVDSKPVLIITVKAVNVTGALRNAKVVARLGYQLRIGVRPV
jgi:hypothetical protein